MNVKVKFAAGRNIAMKVPCVLDIEPGINHSSRLQRYRDVVSRGATDFGRRHYGR